MAIRKIIDVSYRGFKYKGYKTDDTFNSFWLYKTWWMNGEHRKLVAKYGDFCSILCHLQQLAEAERGELG